MADEEWPDVIECPQMVPVSLGDSGEIREKKDEAMGEVEAAASRPVAAVAEGASPTSPTSGAQRQEESPAAEEKEAESSTSEADPLTALEEEDRSWMQHWTPIFGSFVVESHTNSCKLASSVVEELLRIYDETNDLLSNCSVAIAKLRCIFDDTLSPGRVYFSMELLHELRTFLKNLINSLPFVKTRIDEADLTNFGSVLLLGGTRSLLLITHECVSETAYFFETLYQELTKMVADPKLQALDPASGYYYLQASKIYSAYYEQMKSFQPTMKQLRALSQIHNFVPGLTSRLPDKKTNLRFPFFPVDDFLAAAGLMKTDAYVPVPVDFGNTSLGFEYDKYLKDYSRSLKTVYCAMSNVSKTYGGKTSSSPWNSAFSMAFVNYYLNEARRDEEVDKIMTSINVNFLKDAWCLLEDPAVHLLLRSYNSFWASEVAVDKDLVVPIDCALISTSSRAKPLTSVKTRFMSFQPRTVDNRLVPQAEPAPASNLPRSPSTENFIAFLLQRFSNRAMSQTVSSGESTSEATEQELEAIPELEVASPSAANAAGAIVFHIHGGGFIAQSPKSHSFYLKDWVNQTGLPIISLDYSKAPESPYPRAANEAFELYKWLLEPENLTSLGISTCPGTQHKVVLVGDSAGANLCCAVAMKAIQQRVQVPTGLLLHYPVVNITESVSISRLMFANDPVLTSHTLKVCLDAYLPTAMRPNAMKDPLISPGFADEALLKQFPPTIIAVGDIDPLLDDSTFFAHRLLKAGCDVRLKIYRGLPHGYLNLGFVLPASITAVRESGQFLSQLIDQDDVLIKSFELLSCEFDEEITEEKPPQDESSDPIEPEETL